MTTANTFDFKIRTTEGQHVIVQAHGYVFECDDLEDATRQIKALVMGLPFTVKIVGPDLHIMRVQSSKIEKPR